MQLSTKEINLRKAINHLYATGEKENAKNVLKLSVNHGMITGMGTDYLKIREEIARVIQERSVGGKIFVYVDSTDCDWYRTINMYKLPASVMAFMKFERMNLRDAEGPTSCGILTQEEADSFEPYEKDYIMEAYENGRPHCVRYP